MASAATAAPLSVDFFDPQLAKVTKVAEQLCMWTGEKSFYDSTMALVSLVVKWDAQNLSHALLEVLHDIMLGRNGCLPVSTKFGASPVVQYDLIDHRSYSAGFVDSVLACELADGVDRTVSVYGPVLPMLIHANQTRLQSVCEDNRLATIRFVRRLFSFVDNGSRGLVIKAFEAVMQGYIHCEPLASKRAVRAFIYILQAAQGILLVQNPTGPAVLHVNLLYRSTSASACVA